MNRQQQQSQQSQQQQQTTTQQQQQQRVTRTEQHVTRQVTGQMTVQGGQLTQEQIQQIPGFGPNASPPVFEKVFSNARFAQGGVAAFEGRITGKPQPTVSWTRKGAPLLSSQKHRLSYNETTGDVTLQIYQIGPGDEGEYVCTAKNQYGEAVCSVYISPEGMQMPQRFTQSQFEKTTFSNGTVITEDFKIDTFEYRLLREVSYRESITKRSTYEKDSEISTTVERSLGPPAPPQIAQKPRNSKLLEGSDAVFTSKISANPRPRITWFKNGQRIVESQKYESTFTNNQASLRVKQVASDDSGHYTMLAENPQGCVVSSAYLAIEPVSTQEGLIHESSFKSQQTEVETTDTAKTLAPNFVRVCGDRDVTEGKMTRFDCRVTGRPYPEVSWYINGKQVVDDHNHKILVNESGNHALMITTVSRNDSGVVTCVAKNKTGETSFQCNLNVIEKEQVVAPKFVERFTTVNVREGEPVLLNARAVGTPTPRISWQKDGVPLYASPDVRVAIDGGATTLDIPRAKAADAGWYQCTAQNVAGSTATRARLFIETPQGPAPEPRRLHLPRPTKVIEPEPEPGPEVIYLRHVERARPHAAPGEEDRIYPPPRFIIPLQDSIQFEGGKVHFEARIEPVGDPTMVVEWFLNGKLMAASSRATSIFRFGFIALDLISLIMNDAGEYVCRVTSATGCVESRAILQIRQRESIEKTSQHPDSLQYIQQLEDYSKYQRQESLEEKSNQKPHFIRPLQDLGELQEGRNAHFEAQLVPVSDPTMRVEWYKDGRPITASSRITTIFNFGYVSLNIMHLRAEDAGSYTVRAVNHLGEAISTATVQVFSKSTVTGDLGIPEQQRYIEKVQELESWRQQDQQKYIVETPESLAPPEFKTPIKDQLGIREGGFAHFEARLEPVGDSTMKVEWLKDGRPVEASSRITSFFNFGYVALTVKEVTIHDVGHYTCRAYNALGQATTTAQLSVVSKKDIIFDSQHPGGLEKIQHLEDASRYIRKEQEDVQVQQKPRFLGPLKGTNKIVEGQRAHFEARVEPLSDMTLKIEWYFNGKPIQPANRIQTYHDFGYVALDILSVREEDAGTYTVVARNALGEAQVSASMVVETRASIDTRSMHKGAYDKTQHLEQSKFVEPQYHIEEISKSKPIFVVPLSDPQPCQEGRNIHLECRLEPMGDPTMRVEWYCNGRPVIVGSRFRTYNDFGFVALDIIHATAQDSGEYTVRAVNHLGSAHTSACVRVIASSDIITDSQHEQSLEQIQMLEDSSRYRKQTQEDVTVLQAPQFTRPLHNIETVEGTNVHMECRLQPVGDSSMRVEWFCNGFPVKTGHRFRPAYDFDYVALDLLSVYPVDSGIYTCQARNQLGEAVTSCSVKVIAKKDLLFDSQHPAGLEKIQHLEDASRYKRTEFVDEQVTVKPRFVSKPKSLENTSEGQHAHFECKIEPVTDSNLKVEWYKNGRPVTVGHRFRPIHDFGYVALDIVDLIAEDSGTYTCRATNLIGSDETTCALKCRQTGQIITSSVNEQGLQQIQHLEDRSRYQRREEVEEITTQAPIFTTSLKNIDIKEGQRAHFECRLIPVSDATMKVEWFHNGQPLKSGSRFTETNSFGFVALDILYTYPEDAGTYTCRATNALGEAVTSAVCNVQSKKSLYLESVHEGALQRLSELEDSSRYQRKEVYEESVTQAPVFTVPLKDLRTAENQAAHFEARLIPVGDSRLKVEWLRNGVAIQASNRITTMHDFGYVALNMKYVNPEDSGTYTCRAVNDIGEAITSAVLDVKSKASLQLETQHEGALQKLRQLEDSSRYQRREDQDIQVTQAPFFSTQLNGPTELIEGQSAHYECRIEPYPDSNLKVEWFHNGKPLTTGHRFRTAYDFGFASLDVLTAYAEDSGTYTCKATNLIGQAQSSVQTSVRSKASIIRDTQHEGALQKIQYLEDESKYKKVSHEDAIILEKPQFGRGLKTIENLPEGQSAHLEATLTPVNDPTMRVEWFCNGRPIQTGHRFKTTYDFGFVALDILYAYAEDSGTYMCRARNAVGEAATTAAVSVIKSKNLYLETMDEQRLKKLKELETYERPKREEVEPLPQKPVFLTPLISLDNLQEGQHAHLETRVEPINDANLKIEWYVNGVKLKTGHRFRTTHDFGYVALDILYAYAEDSGTYMCKATNLVGEAVNTCTIKVGGGRGILLDTHHPEGLQKIRELEAQGHPARLEIEEPTPTPPRFITELRGTTEIYEGQTAHFEAQVEPIHDSSLRIEFYHNGKPLPHGNRYHITFDFGYISLDVTHAVPEDAGEYSVKAINNLGQCVSSINLRVISRDNIITESQRPEGLDKIRQLEAQEPYKRPEVEDQVTRQRPVFTQPLQNIDFIQEGQKAHFECRLIPVGDPTLKVEWFRNEKPLEDSSRITKIHDFGYVSLDIQHVRAEDEGIYLCRASNPLGEAVTTASMRIRTEANIQLDTKHPEAQRKIAQLEQPLAPRPEEPDRIFEKPIFTQLLTGPTELWEGQHAHFEARVVPVGDPTLRFEWYVNGVELKLGSRFKVTHDFGFVTLDIMSTVPNDSGVYTCKAINRTGEAVSSISMKVKSRSNIVGEPLHPEAWEQIRLKEAEMNKVPEMFVDTTPQQPPVFTTHLKSYDKLVEGQHVYLEAQVEPRTDPNLRIEWFKNGVSLSTGTRLRSTFDFGLVTLSINGLRDDDSAIYTCKATNKLGEAISTCSLKIEDKHWLLGQSLHPDAIPKIEELERPQAPRPDAPEPTYELPIFISHLNNVECFEGDSVHFECNVEPSKDPTMKIEWYVNNKPLPTGAKYKSTYDFGYVALDITHSYEEDSGVYTCKATNSKGSATTSGTLRCTGKKSIFYDTQHPQGKAGLDAIDEVDQAFAAKAKHPGFAADKEYPKPIWTVPLNPEFTVLEGKPLHLEGSVEPKEDPNLKIEWFFNGKSLDHASRFKLTSDFGFVTLDLTDVYERDQGVYTAKASNKAGEAFTSTTIYCTTKANLIERTQHPKGQEGLEKIQNLEDALNRPEMPFVEGEEGHAPVFTSEFTNLTNLSEGEIAHFEAGLTPIGDQTMVVEWFYNGKTIEASHRFRTVHAFGMVVLEVLGVKTEDSGTFTCKATNKWGVAEQSVTLVCVERESGQKPKFTTHIQDIVGLKDGQSAHFECTLVPVNDPQLKVEWYHNGQPILHSSRIKTVSDFGFVVMDISYIQDQDSGEYVCRAYNKYGEDFTRATISAHGKGGVFSESLQPESLAKIRELESFQGQQAQTPTSPVTEPPKFITQIQDVTKLVEGQSAHFEARLTPVTDPDLVVEWYYNGKKLPHGHRYRTFHDFGIVILDILYCYEENSGLYECRAYNKYGEDSTKATLKCISKTNLILDSQLPRGMEGGLEKIQTLEDSLVRTRDEKEEVTKGRAPVFTVPLSNIDSLREGESSHFEARLIPTDDSKLKVEWFWNGKPLRTGSRFRTFCDFGFVILEISPVYPEDSGEYSCRATNEYGEAVTTASMKVSGKRSIILESQLPKGMENTIDKIAELEGLGLAPSQATPEDDSGKPPEFITSPGDLVLGENSLAHFECRLTPVNDPSMRVEWFHNGKALWAGSRIKTINDFGFVILEVAGVYQRDSGMYTCKATNKHGEATVSCTLQVKGRQGIILEPQLPSNFRSGTQSIQKLEEELYKKEEILAEEEKPNPPRFIVEIKDNVDVPEGSPIHFDCRIEPKNDSSMVIEWFHNGKPFATGSRVHQINDFGFISLDIDYTYSRDAGEYICKATNKWGYAITKARVTSKLKRNIDLESQLPAGMSADKLKELEKGPVSVAPEEDKTFGPPKFVTQIQSVTVEESESIRFECRVEPKDDPKLRVEWYRNGKLLPAGHRYRTVYDMGFVSLDILSVYNEDSGEYVCRAVNNYGEDFTKAHVTCKKLPNIILQNQVPKGMKRSETLMQMEAAIKKYTSEVYLTEDDLYDVDKKQPPRFVTQILDQTELVERQTSKFECQLAPVGDPNMKVEWFLNGKPLPHKNRFTPIYDFGYVAMNFGWVYPEDSGEYLCRATNLYGMDETKAVIQVAGKPGIIYESQLPKGMKSIEKIRELEAAWQVVPEEAGEETKPRSAPVFVSSPEPVSVEEGEWARFCCRVTGHPKPRVMWLINGHTVVNGSRYKLTYDGMYHMDIPKTRQYDTGKVEVIARSSVGEAIAETELKIIPRHDDYRGVLKNSPRPWYDLELSQYQRERHETELEKVFDERNTTFREAGMNVSGIHVQPKEFVEEETEWQKSIRSKKGEEFYSKLQEIENEQVSKEIRLREASHQQTIPGEKIVSSSLARGMAQQYQESLEKVPERPQLQPIPRLPKAEQPKLAAHKDQVTLRKTDKSNEEIQTEYEIDSKRGAYPPGPTESGVHGREIYVTKQKQTQKEIQGDLEITRNITATETTDVEHKAKTQERVVQEQVLPSNPPVFTKKIQPCRAFENDSARFEVEFDGDPLPKVTWFREDFPITSSPDLKIYTFSTKSILVLRQVYMEDSGVFSVVAENRGGTAKCSANLVVQERRRQGRGGVVPPSFATTIQSTSVSAGQLVRFDAKINGTKPIDVYWLKNGKKITSDIRYKTLEEDDLYTLLIIEIVPEDAGKYECVAMNQAGEARCEADFTVTSPSAPQKAAKPTTPGTEKAPTIAEPLKDQTIREGQAVAFRCKITGKPTPTAKWLKADKVIKPSRYFQMSKEGDYCTLRISEAFPEDEGVYKCVAENPAGAVTAQAKLRVLAPETQEVAPSLTPMKDVVVPEGSPAQFKTAISGKPKPTIQWLREGFLIPESPDFQMIQEGNNAILLISTTYEEDSGVFACRATSSAGSVEQSAKLTVKKKEEHGIAPRFTQPLKPKIVEETSKAVLQATVIGQPTPIVKWFKEDEEITPQAGKIITYDTETGETTLEILKPSPDDEKIYKVLAENKFGTAVCRANLIVSKPVEAQQPVVTEAPKIIKPTKAVIAKPADEVVLEAEIEGIPKPEVKWFRNGKVIKPDDKYEITETDKTTKLIIKKKVPKKQKAGKYEVRATNLKGEAKSASTVTITEATEEAQPPTWIQPIKPQTAQEGEVVILEAIVEAVPTATFQWFIKDTPVTSSPVIRIVSKDNKSTLLISEVTPEFAGPVTCRAENVAGSVAHTTTINIVKEIPWEETEELVYPRFVKPISPISVMDGEKVTFSCVVVGKPTPRVQWFFNDQPIREAQDVVISQDTEGVCSLAIFEAFPENAGVYTCRAVNKIGEAVCKTSLVVEAYEYVPDSELGYLTGSEEDLLEDKTISEGPITSDEEEFAPRIVKKLPEVIQTKDGHATRLEVKAIGRPKPKGKWLKEGQEIFPSNEFIIESFEDGTSVLTLPETYPDDVGEIVYEAQNPLGVATTVTHLLVESVEGVIGTKLYRKPEWVTQMEELSTALKGKYASSVSSHACSIDVSTDSLEIMPNKLMISGQGKVSAESLKSVVSSVCNEDSPFYLGDQPGTRKSSQASVQSEPVGERAKYRNDFIAATMTDYLNSHRHSVGSVMELISSSKPKESHYESFDVVNSDYEELEQPSVSGEPEEMYEEDIEHEPFFILSPIEEKSEPSTRSSSFRGSSGSEQRKPYSSSCNALPRSHEEPDLYSQERYHTIPKLKADQPKTYYDNTMYPLEPREIDPSAFFQLHTADSQEELQEFLLLESECMSDRGRGLASAFSPDHDEPLPHTYENQAVHEVPTFVKEITDVRTTEAETVVFECIFTGTPTPDIIWYHNNKVLRNTRHVKVRIEDNKTTCTITEVTKDHVGTYVCKAVSEIGETTTKGQLFVQEIPEHAKQEILIRKAKEQQEKITKERVTVEKKRELRKKQRVTVTSEEEIKPLDVTEVQPDEATEEIVFPAVEEVKAKPILDIQEPLRTEAVASCKKIDEKETTKPLEKVTEKLSPAEPLRIDEILAEEIIKDIETILPRAGQAKPLTQEGAQETVNITEVKLEQIIERCEKIIRKSELKMAKEVSYMLELINAKEFGSGQAPLREIAEIVYLLKNGITVKEVTVLYDENKFPSLKSPEAQPAMVNVVERKGHGALISEVLTEETTIDESQLAATVGFRALMKMVEANYVAVEEILSNFIPEDFIQRVWEATEVVETSTQESTKTVTVGEKIEVREDTTKIVKKKSKKKGEKEEFPNNAEPPLFVKRFEEQNIPEKTPLILRAKVTGNPEPEVTWLLNNQPLESSDRVRILYDGENIELTIKETNSEFDSGNYKCVATNSMGRASHGASVNVEVDTVKFTKKLQKYIKTFERETIELECETSHSVRTKWWYNETEISGMDHRVVIQDGRIHKLIIKNISKNDEGNYKCTVKNQKTESTVEVEQRKLEFVKKLQDLEITEKDNAILEVEITSDTADVVWLKDGIPISDTADKFDTEKKKGIRKLLIRSTSIHDEGEYTCQLLEEECKADVTVIELPPEIITPLQDKTVSKGEKAVFDVELSKGDALAKWYKDGKEIQFSEHIQLSIDGKTQKLKIYKCEPEDQGTYTCKVGKQSSSASLTVNVPSCSWIKPLPEETVVSRDTDAEFEVELSREDVEVTWWRKDTKIETSSRYKITENRTFRKLVVRKVTMEDQYDYRCTVEKYNLKTSSRLKVGDKPSPPRGPLEVSGMTAQSFTIQWQPPESDGNSPVLEYIVEIKDTKSKRDFKKIGATKGSVTDIAVSELKKDHSYLFKIYARNAFGLSEPYCPDEPIAAGSRITPPSPPINLNIKDLTSRSATLTWEPPLNDGGSEITGYVVEKKLEYMPKWEKVYTLEAFTLEYTFENLKEKSDYVFRVFAENAVGLSAAAQTDVVQMRTLATVPSPPTAPLEIRTIGPNAIVVEWGIPESDGGAPLLGYNIAIKDTKKTMWMEIGKTPKGVQKFTIRDLQEDHEYMIRIFARNEIGLSGPLESDEPFKVLPSGEAEQDDFREVTSEREPTSRSSETTTSWLRENSMDADISSYQKGKLLRKDEYFFRIWCYATKLFK